jgi:hypothetical protein
MRYLSIAVLLLAAACGDPSGGAVDGGGGYEWCEQCYLFTDGTGACETLDRETAPCSDCRPLCLPAGGGGVGATEPECPDGGACACEASAMLACARPAP